MVRPIGGSLLSAVVDPMSESAKKKVFFVGISLMVLSPLANWFIPTWAVFALLYSGFLCCAVSLIALK